MKLARILIALVATPALAAETPLPFAAALESILSRSTEVQIQRAQLEAAEARAVPKRLAFAPSVAAEAKRAYSGDHSLGYEVRSTSTIAQGTAKLNLFRFGADVANWKVASAEIEAESAALQGTLLSTELAGARAVLERIQRQKEVKVLEDLVQLETTSQKIARERYERGLLPMQEVEKVSVDLANAQARLSEAELREQDSRAALTALLGHAQVETQWPWKEMLIERGASLLEKFKQTDLESLPVVRAARQRQEALDQFTSRAWRLALPSLDADASLGRVYPAGGADYAAWSGTITLSIPLFDRLTQLSTAREQAAYTRAADARLESARREARAEALRAQESFATALAAATAREKTVGLSKKLHEDANRRFGMGRLSSNDLAIEQSRLLDAEQLSVLAWASAHIALVRLYHANGMMIPASDPAR